MSVRAFQPRRSDPPHFVAETGEDLAAMEGDYIGGEQCDGCGNHSYQVRVRMIQPGVRQYEAVCAADPGEDAEFRHPEPCGTAYRITIWDDDLVTF
jgi:hypothetical protein